MTRSERSEWSAFRGGPARNGQPPPGSTSGGSSGREWRFNTDGAVFSSPAVVDDTVYVGSNDGNLYAIATADGTERWRTETDDAVYSSPVVADGVVYVGSYDGTVYAVEGPTA